MSFLNQNQWQLWCITRIGNAIKSSSILCYMGLCSMICYEIWPRFLWLQLKKVWTWNTITITLVSHFKPYDIIHFKSPPVSQSFTDDIFLQRCYFYHIQFRFDCLAWLKKRIETVNTVKMLSMISNEVIILAQLDCNEIAIDRGLDCGNIRLLDND